MACIYSPAQQDEWASCGPWVSGRWLALSCQDPGGGLQGGLSDQGLGKDPSQPTNGASTVQGNCSWRLPVGLLREPQKHSARGRISIWTPATARGRQYQVNTAPLLPAIPPSDARGARRTRPSIVKELASPSTPVFHTRTPAWGWTHCGSGTVSSARRKRCGMKEGEAGASACPSGVQLSLRRARWL